MNISAKRMLLGIPLGVAAIDTAWGLLGHFDIAWRDYLAIGALSLILFALVRFYETKRPDPNIAAMLSGASFLCAFSAGADLLNYLLLTVAGPRIDMTLAHVDRMLGFDWPKTIAFAAAHPVLNSTLHLAYVSSLPQIAALVVCLGLFRQPDRIYRFCFALACGASIAIGFWTFFPSIGALTVYQVPLEIAQKVNIALGGAEARELVAMLAHGPGHIAPSDVKGLIAFPSFHTVMALLTIWYARKLPVLRWVALGLNILVIASTPIHGGHHLIDLAGGSATAALAIWGSGWAFRVPQQNAPANFATLGRTPAFPSV